ncbi:oligosaccharide flippase family protein [Aliivibrio sp. S2TY2]|uniref:oligosaccharide flippase family protein n=1 Tax=unclassified Aliivibrio TaxID=2645654 RepID=UPI00237997B1|nr:MULTISPECIES: oligosaccharide flippase family protein [unclassified Aliivibrio]MDD9174898.1 oligosaccharide flippase family protein [Aliivibrio sp. S3TY1]MDD9192155.1 oligosaccharide flippase family protein [Aliivibrio sp. S2TY2]
MLWILIEKFGSQLITLLANIYMAKIIQPSEFGLIAMTMVFVAIGQAVSESGYTQYLIYKKKSLNNVMESSIFWLTLFISFLFSGFVLCISTWFYEAEVIKILPYMLSNIIISSIAIVPKTKLIIERKNRHIAFNLLISSLLGACFAILFTHLEYEVWAIIALITIKNLTSTFIFFFQSSWRPKLYFDIQFIARSWSFCSSLILGSVLASFVNNISNMMLGKVYDKSILGAYYQSNMYLSTANVTIFTYIQRYIYVKMVGKKSNEINIIIEKEVRVYSTYVLPLFFAFSLVSNEFVSVVLNDNWSYVSFIIKYMAIGYSFLPLISINMLGLTALGKTKKYLRIDIIKHIISILILFGACLFDSNVYIQCLALSFMISWLIVIHMGKSDGLYDYSQIKTIIPFYFIAYLCYLIVDSFITIEIAVASAFLKIIAYLIIYYMFVYTLNVAIWRKNK